jgi:inner membrane protein
MKAGTHLAFVGLLGVGAAGFGADFTPGSGAALVLGALLPDIDTQRSGVGRLAGSVSSWLERRYGHRTLTHSLLGLAGMGILTSPLLLIHKSLWIALLAGYASHLLLDTATVSGVPILWPLRLKFWLVGNRAWRVPYGGPMERAWLATITVTTLALAPLTLDGFTPWFHRALGTSYGAVEDYLRWKDTNEVWATVRGSNLVTGENIDARYRVVDALHTEMILVEDDGGQAYSVGLGQEANISATRVLVWPGEAAQTITERIDVDNSTLGDLLERLPAGRALIHVTATLRTPDTIEPDHRVGRYQRVRSFGSILELRSATPADLEPLAQLWIEQGSALVRMTFPADAEPVGLSRPERSAAGERIVMRLNDLPDLTAIRIAVGEIIGVGDLIAHYPPGSEVTERRHALLAAQAHLAELEREQAAAVPAFEFERVRLEVEVGRVREELERTEWLVAQEAVPAMRLREARAIVAAGEVSLEQHDDASLRALRSGEQDLQEAVAELELFEGRLAEALAALEVRSMVVGRVVSFRGVGSDRRGLDVEVVILGGVGEGE